MLLVEYLRHHWWIIMTMIPIFLCTTEETFYVPTSFRRIGSLASSLTFAHLKIKIDLSNLIKQHQEIKEVTSRNLVEMIAKMGMDNEPIAPFLEVLGESFEPTDQMIEGLKLVFTPTVDEKIGNPDPTMREKRQVVAGLQAVGTLLNLGISLYNTYEIALLNNEMTHVRDGMLHIIETVKEEAHALETLKGTVVALNKTVVGLANELTRSRNRAEFMTAFIFLHTRIQVANAEFRQYCDGLMELLNGRFSPFLVDKTKILTGFRDFRNTVISHGYHLLYDFPSSIFKQDISYTVEGNVIIILIHNPIVKQDSLPLYEYLGLPIVTPNVPNSPLLFAESRHSNTLLVIDPATRRGSELPSSFLTGCKTAKIAEGSVFMCNDFVPIMNNDFSNDCLGLLFTGKITQETLFKSCKIMFSSEETFAQQVDKTKFMVYSKTPAKLTTYCVKQGQAGTTNFTIIQDAQVVNIPPGCQAELGDLILFSRGETFTIEEDNILAPPPTPVTISNSFFPVRKYVDLYKNLKDVKLTERIDVIKLDEWVKDDTWRSTMSLKGTIAFTILSGIMTVVVAYICWVTIKGYLAQKKEKQVAARHREETDAEHIEMLDREARN